MNSSAGARSWNRVLLREKDKQRERERGVGGGHAILYDTII